MNALEITLDTNLLTDNITSFIQFQINDMRGWEFESANLVGTDGIAPTYSFPKMQLYVMNPDQESIDVAKAKIGEYLK